MFNPYGQSGWPSNQNPNGLGSSASIPPQPSLFGLLPSAPSRTPEPNLLSFKFTSFNPNILNSAITGPRSRGYFRITTDTPTVGFTVFFDATGNPIAIIEWLDQPVVEIRGILSKRRTSDWLALAQNGSHRKMEALGKHFVWAPGGDYIFLYAAGVGRPQVYAQVSRGEDSVKLEMTPEAIQIGLLEICVVATFLLQCGKNIG
ncbi:hypothetical protein C8F04DRAFT_1233308 [Mycena alexandri]|uniref:Uncharacterized protein n=1 Tax=Mycena alexandri TaxID=1745969 RepID=A0AAD6SZY8_9AGAR|nr:hypothetical protein C8F04DRAFT_1233308 [Mycena alexandri]